jgi:hypothetical protein
MNHPLPRAALAVAVALATMGVCASPALAAPAPHRGRTVIVARFSGAVRIAEPHGNTVTVHRAVALRSGGTLFTTGGVAAVTVSTLHGTKTARVAHGDSRVTQSTDGETTFALTGLACASDAMSDARRPPTDTLWVHDHHGPFISRGGYASGAARGTEWTTTDTCDSTAIRVREGTVLVTDFVRHRHVLISAGHTYTAHRSGGGSGASVPVLSWSAPQPIAGGAAINSISCPTTSFCAGTDTNGDVLTTADPAAGSGSWTTTNLISEGAIDDDTSFVVSCPSPRLCVASDFNGDVYVSTNPTGGAATWHATAVVNPDGDSIQSLTCPSTSLCVAGDLSGNVIVSTDPTSGAWSTSAVSKNPVSAISCVATTLCIAGGNGLSTSMAPTHGTSGWRTTSAFTAVNETACPTTKLCLLQGIGPDGSGFYASTSPAGGPSTYHLIGDPTDGNGGDLACPSADDCITVDDDGVASVSIDPAAGHWKSKKIDSARFLNAIACPTTGFCVAVDNEGDALVGRPRSASAGSADVIASVPRTARRPSAAATSTRVVVMAGFTVGGVPTMRITRTVRGSCFSTSDAALRRDAYRCMSGNELFDPCLAPPPSVKAGNVVVCPTDPFRNTGIEIRLTRRLPRNTGPAPSDRGVPFAIRLTNGCEATVDTGATAAIGRTRANYYCARTHQWLWGAPSRRGRLWTIWSAPLSARHLTRRVSIAEAWF